MSEKAEDIKKLIEYCIKFAETMSKVQQKFNVFSATLDLKGDLLTTGYYDAC